MRRFSMLCAAAAVAATAFVATSPAQAGYHLIKWSGTGFCQVWDESVPTTPWPSDYRRVSRSVATFTHALATKDYFIKKHWCAF